MKKLLLSALAIASFGMFGATAQLNITITQADFVQASNTTNIVMMVDTTPSISVGSAGLNQTWDFSGLSATLVDTNTFDAPETTGIDAEFTNANLKWQNTQVSTFLQGSSTTVEIEGILAEELVILGFPLDLGGETAFVFDNSMTFIEFPSTYNDSYIDTSTFTYAFPGTMLEGLIPGVTIDSVRTRHTSYLNSDMDAEGSVTAPGNVTYDALRQHRVEYRIDTLELLVTDAASVLGLAFAGINVTQGEWSYFQYNGVPNPVLDTMYTYSWYANNEEFPVVNIEVDENDKPLRASWTYTDYLVALVNNLSNSSCAVALDGSINIDVYGGSIPYTYKWDNGETAAKAFKLSAGNHSVTVTDNLNETFVLSAMIEANPDFSVALSTSPMSCDTCGDGAVAILNVGGEAPYAYNWSNGATTESITGLSGGANYSITVTDKNGCSATTSTYISGLESISNNEILVYPNPVTNGVLNIITTENMTLSFYNLIGDLVKFETITGNTSIQLTDITPGLYLVQFETKQGTVTRKITIE